MTHLERQIKSFLEKRISFQIEFRNVVVGDCFVSFDVWPNGKIYITYKNRVFQGAKDNVGDDIPSRYYDKYGIIHKELEYMSDVSDK